MELPNQVVPFTTQAFFLDGNSGRLAGIFYKPVGVPHRADLLYAHPFGHELFNSRPVMASVFRALAKAGIGVLSLDLLGCGDSEGDFQNARWETWLDDLNTGSAWLRNAHGLPLNLCGLRLGAALMLDFSRTLAQLDRLILLQPVLNGKEMTTQFLRLRVAFSGLENRHQGPRETTQGIRQRLNAGERIEVAGYILSPELVHAIERVDLPAFNGFPKAPIEWIESNAPPDSAHTARLWKLVGADVRLHHVPVKPYWTHTRANAPFYQPLAETLVGIFA
jgi:exosortase A-associated hydrolase 2